MSINHRERKILLDPQVLALELGASVRVECPWCGVDDGFVVWRDDNGLFYKDWRVSCGVKGFIPSDPANFFKKSVRKSEPKADKFQYDTVFLTETQVDYLSDKFNLTYTQIAEAGWKWCPTLQRVIMPIFNVHGWTIGIECRYYPDLKVAPPRGTKKYGIDRKVVTVMWDKTQPRLYWPKPFKFGGRHAVLVEDMVSAIRVNTQTPCVAMLGTDLNYEAVSELMDSFDCLTICLDAGREEKKKAQYIKNQYSLLFDKITVAEVPQDPKYLSDEQIHKLIMEPSFGRKENTSKRSGESECIS